jgi:hypothetical protein
MPSLSEPLLKLDRANEHLVALRAERESFMGERPHPYGIVAQKETNDAVYVVHLKVLRELPVRLGILVGDFVHNARAALDYLAWQLSLTTKPDLAHLPGHKRPVTDVEFPLFLTEPPGGIKTHKGLRFVPDEAKGEIESLQPYKRVAPPSAPWIRPTDDWLWVLYRLANRDKHRHIAPVGLRVQITINPNSFPRGVKDYVAPFQDGHILGLFPEELIDDRERALKIEPSFDVLFSEAGPTGGVGMNALSHLHDYIRDVVFPRFARFF